MAAPEDVRQYSKHSLGNPSMEIGLVEQEQKNAVGPVCLMFTSVCRIYWLRTIRYHWGLVGGWVGA